jgi:ribokinase
MSDRITVIGSLNMDFVVQVEHLPMPGETVLGSGFTMALGGKGANQACAVGKLGGDVRVVGRVGDDVFGEQLCMGLAAAGVDTRNIFTTAGVQSGVALIFVQDGGQNQIVVAPGANALLTPDDVSKALEQGTGGFVLLQLEVPLAAVEAAAAHARRAGARVILDPAPAQPLPDTLLAAVDILTPNESEARMLLGHDGGTLSLAEAHDVARAIRAHGARTVILKLGAQGAFLDEGHGGQHFPGVPVDAVDATAAGDVFNAGLAVALSEGRSIDDAIRFANTAAAISVTRLGAQTSVPTRAEAEAALDAR